MKHPLILLFGLPRSGTTWIGKIFDSHPDTLYRHEPDSWGRLNDIPLLVEPGAGEAYCGAAVSFVDGLREMRETKISASLPVFRKSYISNFRYYLLKGVVRAAKLAARMRGECRLPRLVNVGRSRDIHIVWKSIESLGRLGLLMECVPGSRAVHIIRHPCGQIASVLRGEASSRFTSGVPQSEDTGMFRLLLETPQAKRRGLDMNILNEMSPVERLAWRWLIFNEKAMEDSGGHERRTTLRYEDLCREPFEYTEKMFSETGLSVQRETTEFIRRSTGKENDSYYSIYKDSRTSAERWKNELCQGDIYKIMDTVSESAPGRLYAQ